MHDFESVSYHQVLPINTHKNKYENIGHKPWTIKAHSKTRLRWYSLINMLDHIPMYVTLYGYVGMVQNINIPYWYILRKLKYNWKVIWILGIWLQNSSKVY